MSPRSASAPDDPGGAPADWDAIEGARSPRDTERLIGQDPAMEAFDAAWESGRRHHAWLLRGPSGVGKATAAYAIARRVLRASAIPGEDVDAQIAAAAHPSLLELRRSVNESTKKLRTMIVVDDIRRLQHFFQMSAPDGRWRVALIDPADDLNVAAANALLKMLEEPPKAALFLLVTHRAGRLAATLRSRCRRLDFTLLDAAQAAAAARAADPSLGAEEAETLARLAGGAPGEALRLRQMGGLELYGAILRFIAAPMRGDRLQPLTAFATRRQAQPPPLEALSRLAPLAIERLVRLRHLPAERAEQEAAPGERETAAALIPSDAAARRWAEASATLREKLEAAAGLNLDPARSILDTALYLDGVSRQARAE